MKRLLLGALGLASFAFPAAAQAFPGHYHPHYHPYRHPVQVSFGFTSDNFSVWVQPTASYIPVHRPVYTTEHCIYRPLFNRLICRY